MEISACTLTLTSLTLFGKGRAVGPGLPDFSSYNIPQRGKIKQITTLLPNGHNMFPNDV
jgi:hypothetical protein